MLMTRLLIFAICCLAGLTRLYSTSIIVGERFTCIKNVTFYSVTLGTKKAAYYNWILNGGKTSTNAIPGVYWTNTGKFILKVTVKFTDSSAESDTFMVTVNNPPKAVFSLTDSKVCLSKNKFTFKNLSTGDNGMNTMSNIKITYGDGTTEENKYQNYGTEYSHTYTKAQQFVVNFFITDVAGCKSDTSLKIIVRPEIKGSLTAPTITRSCGENKLCISAQLDTMGLIGNLYIWNIDGDVYTESYLNSHCRTFKYTNRNAKISLFATNKYGCTSEFYTESLILSDTITATWNARDTALCIANLSDIEYKVDNIGSQYEKFLWYLDSTLLSKKSMYSIKLNNISKQGTYKIKLDISDGYCKKQYNATIIVKGFIPNVKWYNTTICREDPDISFGIDSTLYNPGAKIYRLWAFDDLYNNASCTTIRKDNINKKSNCNYTEKDQWAKHYFSEKGRYKCSLYQYDSSSGCAATSVKYVVKTDCEFLYTEMVDAEGTITKCMGDSFLHYNEYVGLKPDQFSFDNSYYRPFPGILIPSDEGTKKIVWFRFLSKVVSRPFISGDSLLIHRDTLPAFNIRLANAVTVINLRDNPIVTEQKGNCDTAIFLFKPNLKPYTQNIKVVFTDSFDNVLYVAIADTTHPFTGYSFKVPKDSTAVIKVYVSSEKCKWQGQFTIGLGTRIEFSVSKLCKGMPAPATLDAFTPGQSQSWRYNKFMGNVFCKINDVLYNQNAYNFNLPTQYYGSYKVKIIAIDKKGCKDSLEKTITIDSIAARIQHFKNPITCSEGSQFFDSSSLFSLGDSIKTYRWEIMGTTSQSLLKDPIFTENAGGSYTLKHTIITQKGCIADVYAPIVINGPIPSYMVDTFICLPEKAKFTNTSKYCTSYIWFFGDTRQTTYTTDKDTTIIFDFREPGIYYPVLVGSGEFISVRSGKKFQCNVSFPKDFKKSIKIQVYKGDTFHITGPDTVCTNSNVPFILTPQLNTSSEFKWDFGDGQDLTSNDSASHIYQKSGNYNISILPSPLINPTCNYYFPKKIVITEVKADFRLNDTLLPLVKFTNLSAIAHQYHWNFGDPESYLQNTSTEANPTHEYIAQDKDIEVCLLAVNKFGCRDSICKRRYIRPSERIKLTNVFTPGVLDGKNDCFDIIIDEEDYYELKIYNRYGALVYKSNIDGNVNNNLNWNGKVDNKGADCPEGTYFYEFIYSFKSNTDKKIIKGSVMLIR